MIRKIKENEISWFHDLSLEDIGGLLPSQISIHSKVGAVGLYAEGVVGSIELRNGDTLQIVPKFDDLNFLELLFKSEGLESDLLNRLLGNVDVGTANSNVSSIVCRQIFYAVAEIISKGSLFSRSQKVIRGDYFTGRVDFLKTSLNIESKIDNPVISTSKLRNFDTPENRVITEALIRSRSYLSDAENKEFYEIFSKWVSKYHRSYSLREDIQHVESLIAAGEYGGSRSYYLKVLTLSLTILGITGIGFNTDSSVRVDAFFVNTADVYEKYIRNVIRDAYGKKGYVVAKEKNKQYCLYTNGAYKLEPDVLIYKNGELKLIVDAKYKQPTSGDHYQMVAYLNSFGIKRGVFVSPLNNIKDVVVKEYANNSKMLIREVFLPIENLPEAEKFLSSFVEIFS